jgi:hypothetical protein
MALEKAYQEKIRKGIRKFFFSSYGLENLNDCIVYLHGHKKIDFAIIKKEDYDYFYPNVSRESGIPIIESFL